MATNILSLEGKTAVVIGGTSGIGRTLSLGLADAGADVIASARRQEQVDETAAEIERRGRQTLRLCSDEHYHGVFGAAVLHVVDSFVLRAGKAV
jgi:NAD(P)-dependent dehydrogenase (short-subunit alcohol dehydrogenase family)